MSKHVPNYAQGHGHIDATGAGHHNSAFPSDNNPGVASIGEPFVPMVHTAPVSAKTVPGFHCPDCRAIGVQSDHLCDARAARLASIYGREVTAQESASWNG